MQCIALRRHFNSLFMKCFFFRLPTNISILRKHTLHGIIYVPIVKKIILSNKFNIFWTLKKVPSRAESHIVPIVACVHY